MNGDRLRSMPLPCRLGWHRVDPLAQWNSGYYFTTCERCGRDLVRTAFDGWRVPSGYRVVWQAEPPTQRRAELVTIPDPVREPDYASDRPIEFPFVHTPRAEPQPRNDEQPAVAEALVREVEPDIEAFSGRGSAADMDDLRTPPVQEAPPSFAEVDTTAGPRQTAAESLIPDWWDEPVRVATPFDAEIAARASIEARSGMAQADAVELVMREQDTEMPLAAMPEETEPPALEPEAAHSVDELLTPSLIDGNRPEPRYPIIPDFMDEGAAATAWDGSPMPISVDTMTNLSVSERARRNWHVMQGGLQRRVQTLRVPARRVVNTMSAYRMRRGSQVTAGVKESGGTIDSWARQVAVTLVALLAGVALVAAVLSRNFGGSDASPVVAKAFATPMTNGVSRPTGLTSIVGEAMPDQGFVTASLLNCRATPAADGTSVRKLARGAAVQILGVEPSWLSISHRGRQCWASSRFISTTRPL